MEWSRARKGGTAERHRPDVKEMEWSRARKGGTAERHRPDVKEMEWSRARKGGTAERHRPDDVKETRGLRGVPAPPAEGRTALPRGGHAATGDGGRAR